MGGAHGFGPVVAEADEPWFHAEWERRVFALAIALGAGGRVEHRRLALRPRGPAAGRVPRQSYYELWLAGLERLLAERGSRSAGRVLRAEEVEATLARGGPASRATAAGARVRRRGPRAHPQHHPHTHTRLPRYARDKVGTVERCTAPRLPGQQRALRGRGPAVALHRPLQRARAVGTDDDASVSIDAFEPYLEPA